MKNNEKTPEELLIELKDLQLEYNSSKESCEKEISGLRQLVEKLRKSDEKYRLAYMTSPDAININRLSDGMYTSVNDGFTRILGYTEDETIGRTSLEMNVWADPEDRAKMVKELEAKGNVKDYEADFLSKETARISTRAPFGSLATCTVARAGGAFGKKPA